MILDVTSVIVLGCHELHLFKMVNLTVKGYVYALCSTKQLLPCLSPSLLKYNNIEIKPINDPTVTSNHVKVRIMSFTLNQEPEITEGNQKS